MKILLILDLVKREQCDFTHVTVTVMILCDMKEE